MTAQQADNQQSGAVEEGLPQVFMLEQVHAALEPDPAAGPLPEWVEQNRPFIADNWQRRLLQTPALFNGIVLLRTGLSLKGTHLHVTFQRAEFATFLALLDSGFPHPDIGNCFGLAALRSADHALLAGVMGAHTANAGRVYFPGGTPDCSDVRADGIVDLYGSVRRELEEETGLKADEMTFADGWTAIIHGSRTALLKDTLSAFTAEDLQQRIETFLASETQPELSSMRILRHPGDFDAGIMPCFMRPYMERMLPAKT